MVGTEHQPEQLRVDGAWLSHTDAWGDLTWSTQWPGGDFEISWSMDPGRGRRIADDAVIEVMDGPLRLCTAQLQEPPSGLDDDDGTYTAMGLARVAAGYQALNSAGDASTNVRASVDQAIGRGWGVTRSASVPIITLTDSAVSEALVTVAALLDAAAVEEDLTWHVGADRALRFSADPTTPAYYLRPGMVDLSPASADFARTVCVRYVKTDGSYATAFAPGPMGAGAPERAEDVTSLGPIPTARATRIATGLLAQVQRPGWTGGLDVGPGDLTTPGGQPADLRRVRAGQMVRLHGLASDADALGGRTYLDVVLGEVSYATTTRLATITPINAAAAGWIKTFAATLSRSRP